MKKRIYIAMVTVALIGLFAAVPAKAQLGKQVLSATIPFEFSVGQTMLPAGEYIVRQVDGNSQILVGVDLNRKPRFLELSSDCPHVHGETFRPLIFFANLSSKR